MPSSPATALLATRFLATALLLGSALPLSACAELKDIAVDRPPPGGGVTSAHTLAPGDNGYIEAGPWAGPLHQKYAGKVVFSSAPIPKDATDDSAVIATYTLGDPLYARYWARDSAHNILPSCGGGYRTILRVDVDGDQAEKPPARFPPFGSFRVASAEQRSMASLTNDLDTPLTKQSTWAPDTGQPEGGDRVPREWGAFVVPRLDEGDNTVRVVITLDCGTSGDADPILAEGTLKVLVPPGAKTAYLAKYGTQLPPSPHPENAKLWPKIVALVDAMPDWDNEIILGARVVSAEWTPVRHKSTGTVTHYMTSAVLVVRRAQESNSDVCRAFSIHIERDAKGGASAPLRLGGVGTNTPFPCANAPK